MSETLTTSTDTPGNSPGAVLKRCREFHEISLEEASQTTKIGVSYIKALEDDEIGAFANLTYLKGFLRIYASYLGLNPDDMARMYDKLYGSKDGKKGIEEKTAETVPSPKRLLLLRKLLFPAVLLLLILITATLFSRQYVPVIRLSQSAAPPSVSDRPVAAVQKPASSSRAIALPQKAEEPPPDISESAAKASDKTAQPAKTVEPPKGFILKIRVTQNGNLNVVVDSLVAQVYELTVGDIIEWKAEKSVALDLSNAGGVEVELNGKPFKQLGPPGKPVYIVMDADGVKP